MNWRLFAAAMFAALVIGAIEPAQATVFPAQGGTGDVSEEYRCPSGHVLVGFAGRSGHWIDGIGLICSRVLPGLSLGSVTTPPPKGGSGGSPDEQYCEPDAAIRAIKFFILYDDALRRPQYIEAINLSCVHPKDGTPAQDRAFGRSVPADPDRTALVKDQACPGSEYATGLNIRYGKHVNAVGLICGAVEPDRLVVIVPQVKPADPPIQVILPRPPGGSSPPPQPAPPQPTAAMTGTFDTNLGVLVLAGNAGTYSILDGRVTVTGVTGDAMDGTWNTSWSAQRCGDGLFRGRFRFTFNAAGFTGAYGFCDGPLTAGAWNGQRR